MSSFALAFEFESESESKDPIESLRAPRAPRLEKDGSLGFSDALELLRSRQGEPRLTTGSVDLDSLLGGGIRPGAFYLFYGDEGSGVDALIHQILVNSLLPVWRGGLGGRAIYLNCGNYREGRTVLDIGRLTWLAKAAGLDPSEALDRIKVFLAFNPEQEEKAVGEAYRTLKDDPGIRTLVIHNMARLFDPFYPFDPEKRPKQDMPERLKRILRLQGIVSRLSQACAEAGVAMVATCRPRKAALGRVPEPEGGHYLRHACNVLVYMRRIESRGSPGIQAYLRKHPSREPLRITIAGGLDPDLGRITIPFRTAFEEELRRLKEDFREALLDPKRQEAFDLILRGWTSELGAMSHAKVPTVLDVMLLVAAVDNRKVIEDLYEKVRLLGEQIEELRKALRGLSVQLRDEDL